MPPTRTPLLDPAEISAAILRRISEREPTLEDLARRQLGRLTPERWTIEWHLPAWLGRRFDLDPLLVEALARGNVLGLLSIRLEDDLQDGEVASADATAARALARWAYAGAVAEYRAWFANESPIWGFLERSMADWRAGAAGRTLATRGAPVKVAGFACCLQAGRLDLWSALERSLEGAVTALVLYDQFCDWEADLDAGRWNAFVARIAAPQALAVRERNRAAVLTAMLTSDVVRGHFDAAEGAANEAATIAARLGVDELAAFLTAWATRTSEQGRTVADHYRRAGDQAARLLLGTTIGGAAP